MKRILIYDGDCGICSYLAAYLMKRTKLPLHALPEITSEIEKDYGEELSAMAQSGVLYIEGGSVFYKTRAVGKCLLLLPYPMKLLAYLFTHKMLAYLFNPIYDLIARNRHKISRLFGLASCKIKS
jgi:predicted DCC family thiol-disulfide oxidoreductase YuxK